MAITNTTRLNLYQWSDSNDEFTRVQMTDSHQSLEDNVGMFVSAANPTPPTAGAVNERAFYWDSSTDKLYFRGDQNSSLGTHAWQQIYPVLPAGHVHSDLQPLDSDLTAIAGLSTTGLITRSGSGTAVIRQITTAGTGISITNGDGVSGNPLITLNSATAATASTIVLRDGSGRFQAVSPSVGADVAIKSYVDAADALKADASSVYTQTQINAAKLYQYANEAGGTGSPLPPSGTRTTPRIYVQSTSPSTAGAITGDIWFQI